VPAQTQLLRTPRAEDLGLVRLSNAAGLAIGVLPNGGIFAIEHVQDGRRIMVNRTLGSPLAAADAHTQTTHAAGER